MTKINVIQPGTIEAPPGEIPFLVLPERNTFQTRAARLSAAADSPPMRIGGPPRRAGFGSNLQGPKE